MKDNKIKISDKEIEGKIEELKDEKKEVTWRGRVKKYLADLAK